MITLLAAVLVVLLAASVVLVTLGLFVAIWTGFAADVVDRDKSAEESSDDR